MVFYFKKTIKILRHHIIWFLYVFRRHRFLEDVYLKDNFLRAVELAKFQLLASSTFTKYNSFEKVELADFLATCKKMDFRSWTRQNFSELPNFSASSIFRLGKSWTRQISHYFIFWLLASSPPTNFFTFWIPFPKKKKANIWH